MKHDEETTPMLLADPTNKACCLGGRVIYNEDGSLFSKGPVVEAATKEKNRCCWSFLLPIKSPKTVCTRKNMMAVKIHGMTCGSALLMITFFISL
jgi:hypothetical protein